MNFKNFVVVLNHIKKKQLLETYSIWFIEHNCMTVKIENNRAAPFRTMNAVTYHTILHSTLNIKI